MRLAWIPVPVCHARVGIDRKGTGDMGTGQDSCAIVVITKAEVESSYTLKVGVLEGCNGETQSGSEGLSKVGNIVEKGVEREELGARTNRTSNY